MTVTVRLFARLRDIAGAGGLERTVPAGATVEQVWAGLAEEFPGLAAHRAALSAAVNAEFAAFSTELKEGDEVAFLPPVSGG